MASTQEYLRSHRPHLPHRAPREARPEVVERTDDGKVHIEPAVQTPPPINYGTDLEAARKTDLKIAGHLAETVVAGLAGVVVIYEGIRGLREGVPLDMEHIKTQVEVGAELVAGGVSTVFAGEQAVKTTKAVVRRVKIGRNEKRHRRNVSSS